MSIKEGELLEILKKDTNGPSQAFHFLQIYAQKANSPTGWCLAKNSSTGTEGWAPSAYLKEEPTAAPAPIQQARAPPPPPPGVATAPVTTNGTTRAVAKAKPTPPVPPAKRPIGKKSAAVPAPRDSAVSMGLNGDSGRATPESVRSATPSLAGGLAEALRARQASMQGKKEEDDDW